jgi:hypothetical protein
MDRRTDYVLYVNYARPVDESIVRCDAAIDAIAEKYSFENMGSGGGLGARDLDYMRPEPLTEEQVTALTEEFKALDYIVQVAYDIEVWEGDDQVDEECVLRVLVGE